MTLFSGSETEKGPRLNAESMVHTISFLCVSASSRTVSPSVCQNWTPIGSVHLSNSKEDFCVRKRQTPGYCIKLHTEGHWLQEHDTSFVGDTNTKKTCLRKLFIFLAESSLHLCPTKVKVQYGILSSSSVSSPTSYDLECLFLLRELLLQNLEG